MTRRSEIRVAIISDTHCKHRLLPPLQKCDLFIHAGDFTSRGRASEIRDFNDWLNTINLPPSRKIVIAGNHDLAFDFHSPFYDEKAITLLTNCTYLQDSSYVIDGVKVYGSPYTPAWGDWAFGLERGRVPLFEKWNAIPEDTDILITHGPPFGKLDHTENPLMFSKLVAQNVGCELLNERIEQMKKLKLHVFGHVHQTYSTPMCEEDGVVYVNGSMFGWSHTPVNNYTVIDL